MTLTVTIENAYREACTALGESIVVQRLQAAELVRRDAAVAPPAAVADDETPA